jgi:hypothetical protein
MRTLAPGVRLGAYEILAAIGAGGINRLSDQSYLGWYTANSWRGRNE